MKRDLIEFDETFAEPVQERTGVENGHAYQQRLDDMLFGMLVLAYWLGAYWFACATLMA
jgi:hypothetical protein